MSYLLTIQNLFPDGLRADTPEAASWRCFFEQRVDLVEAVRGLSRAEAERAAYEQVLITFLNKTYPDTSPHACAECGGSETPDANCCRSAGASGMRGCTRAVWTHGGPSDGLRPKTISLVWAL
jgi:hypothetical protein